MSNLATFSIILNKSKKYKNGECPIYLKITKDRKRKHKSINGLTCQPKYWNDKRSEPRRNHPNRINLKEIIDNTVNKYEKAQVQLQKEGKTITIDRIINKVENPNHETLTVLEFYERVINDLELEGKASNANHYRDIKKQFANFLKKQKVEDVLFSDIDYSLLKNWKLYLKERGLKGNTLFAYFKNLRSLYNKAIKEGIAKKEDYPFYDFNISKFKEDPEKYPLTVEDVKAIENFDVSKETKSIMEAKQFAIFSYYTYGINLTDMAYIRWWDVDENNVLRYTRRKTGETFAISLMPQALEIIEYFKPLTENSPYIFPILNPQVHQTETQKTNRIQKVRTRTNKALKEIAKRAGIERKITMYTFRHSFATNLRDQDVPQSVIKEALGHKTEAQTETYLAKMGYDRVSQEIKKALKTPKHK